MLAVERTMLSSEPQRRAKRRFYASLAMAMSIYSLLLSSVSAEATSVEPFVRGSLKRRSDELGLFDLRESEDPPNRVPIHSFRIVLKPTPQPLTVTDAEAFHDFLQMFLSAYVKNEMEPKGVVLDYLMLADVNVVKETRRRLEASNSSTLFVSAGVASFTSDDYPTEAELEALMATGIESNLKGTLVGTDYAYIEAVDYISLTPSPTASPQTTAGAEKADQGNVDSNKEIGIIAAGAIGAFIGVVIIGAALLSRRHRGPSLASHLERDHKDNETQLDDDASLQTSGDRRARDDSDTWTSPSLADDANTIFTNFSIKSLFTSAGIHRTESFERDRQVSLRKDMLHMSPAWATTELSRKNSERQADDAVLKPSHSVVDDELEVQSSSGVNSDVAPFRFQEANDEGEEIYLMPPKKRKSKVPLS